jgi:polyketide cyclase/dehydrase/lipid transport protein
MKESVMTTTFALHGESNGEITAGAEALFAYLDDPRNLAEHMESSSAMMAGSVMHIEVDAQGGRDVGSQIRMSGRMLGLPLSLEEAITERTPPLHKAWQTFGTPRLIVIGHYRMGFDLQPADARTRLRVWIDYQLPSSGMPHWLAKPLARAYAHWCTEQMVRTARKHFDAVAQPA